MRFLKLSVVAALGAMVAGCAKESARGGDQRAFDTPAGAVEALEAAVSSDDTGTLDRLFGPEGREMLSSGDAVADRNNREVFSVAMAEGWELRVIDHDTQELVVGNEGWPFPVPLQKGEDGWSFDSAAGKDEILARRIGRNELAAIGVLRTYAIAQRDYAATGHDGHEPGVYAQKIRSDAGVHNGLYWEQADEHEAASPLGEFAANAALAGYTAKSPEGATPYYGYFYRVLTAQGGDADGGARDYIVDGKMTGGFAMIAYPAEYLNSGVMSFIIGPDGMVYESDLGQDTGAIARSIQTYNPDADWSLVE